MASSERRKEKFIQIAKKEHVEYDNISLLEFENTVERILNDDVPDWVKKKVAEDSLLDTKI